MTAPIDHKPEHRRPIVIAAELARAGNGEAATTIRDLVELAKALNRSSLNWTEPASESDRDTIGRLEWMIE